MYLARASPLAELARLVQEPANEVVCVLALCLTTIYFTAGHTDFSCDKNWATSCVIIWEQLIQWDAN